MDLPGSPEWTPRPELDRRRPERIFTYAHEKQKYLRERVAGPSIPAAVDNLVNELETFISHNFENLPELLIETRDVNHTLEISGSGPYVAIESGPMPMEGDAALYKEHTIRGTLYGFHRGDKDEIRVYVATSERIRYFMGGIYTPLLSVGVEGSDIRFAESLTAEKIEELGAYITEQLRDYDGEVKLSVAGVLRLLNDQDSRTVGKLHRVSPILASIAAHKDTSLQFVDTLFEIIKLKLHLDVPNDIDVSSYRERDMTEGPIAFFRPKGPESFPGVVPQFGIMGVTDSRGLGVFFINDEKIIEIPVQYITGIRNAGGA